MSIPGIVEVGHGERVEDMLRQSRNPACVEILFVGLVYAVWLILILPRSNLLASLTFLHLILGSLVLSAIWLCFYASPGFPSLILILVWCALAGVPVSFLLDAYVLTPNFTRATVVATVLVLSLVAMLISTVAKSTQALLNKR